MIRLQKYLAKAGVASRRKAEILIQQGRVTVNGERAQLGMKVDENKDAICIDGKKVITDKKVYLLFNKPQGVVTTRFDPQGRPTVMDYLHDIPASIHPVGRLDYDSEGLLLLTNDGDLTLLLTHPRYQFPKTYQVLLQGKATGKIIQHLEQGVLLNGGKTAPAKARIIGYQNGNTLMEYR
jgi:pseudouridine synthase